MAWRLANSLVKLRDQVNVAYPNRSKVSDGTIGDAAHQLTLSDHNPNQEGVVCALDLTHSPQTGFDAHILANSIRVNRHPDIKYVISNSRIAGWWTNWEWQPYGGSNPHSSHIHVSVGRGDDGQSLQPYDNMTAWLLPGSSQQATKKSNEDIASEVLRGEWGNNPVRRDSLIAAGYDYNTIQAIVNGKVGNPIAAPQKGNEIVAAEVITGAWGNNPERQNRLEAAGYNYQDIQAIVNRLVSGVAPAKTEHSNEQIADQVLAGSWGNGDERKNRLTSSGYDFDAIQSIVNARLGQTSVGKASDDEVANQVIQGSWGNGQERVDRLSASGYNPATIQELVNRKLGF